MSRRLESLSWIFAAAGGVLLLGWLLLTPPGLLGKADAIAYAVCHRIASHSFFIDDRQFPLCARCTGMYLGVLLGLAFGLRRRALAAFPPRRLLLPLAGFALAFLVDGLNSFSSLATGAGLLYAPDNTLRLLTGTGFGVAAGVCLATAFKQVVWEEIENRPALGTFRQLALLAGLGLILDLGVLSSNPLLLIPLALLAAAGVPALLTVAYSMLWTILLKRENANRSWQQLAPVLTAGLTTALLQVILVDALRLALTGTWAGFSL